MLSSANASQNGSEANNEKSKILHQGVERVERLVETHEACRVDLKNLQSTRVAKIKRPGERTASFRTNLELPTQIC